MTQITIPLPESLVLAIGALLAFGLASALVVFAMMPAKAKPKEAIASFQSQMGLDRLPTIVFFAIVASWGAIFLVLLIGILITIFDTIWRATPGMLADDSAERLEQLWEWRFQIAKLAALTAVLGAVIALPFTTMRLALTSRQTSATETGLLVDRLASASQGLSATIGEGKDLEPNILMRSSAIMSFRSLALETPDLRSEILKVLTNFISENLHNYPKQTRSKSTLVILSSDMHSALGTCYEICEILDPVGDFSGRLICDLRATDFSKHSFLESRFLYAKLNLAVFKGTRFHGVKFKKSLLRSCKISKKTRFFRVSFDRCMLRSWHMPHGCAFIDTKFCGSALRSLDLTDCEFINTTLANSFGDASVALPPNIEFPEHWATETLDDETFHAAWKKFQRSLGTGKS